MINARVDDIVQNLFKEEETVLSEEDRSVLKEHREEVIERLEAVFRSEIPALLQEGESRDPNALYRALNLAGFLEASEVFSWVVKLLQVSIDNLDDCFGPDFITGEFPHLLNRTMDCSDVLKTFVEDPDLDEFLRSACIEAWVLSCAAGKINRSELLSYFKTLFARMITGEVNDPVLCTHLILYCSDLWPGECLEEIRECFGLELVDEMFIDLDYVLDKFSLGLERCLENLQSKTQEYDLWVGLTESGETPSETSISQLESLFKRPSETEKQLQEIIKHSKEPERNETCRCGSGRKYKKCCINKPSLQGTPSTGYRIGECVISYDPLPYHEAFAAVPDEVKQSMLDLRALISKDPHRVIEAASEYIREYPNIPMLYNFLSSAYRIADMPQQALKLLKETSKKFPDYLFGRLDYADYLLRRGEPDKAYAVLGNIGNLPELYPERKIFHATEWAYFSRFMALYWIEKQEFKQAGAALEELKKIFPKSSDVEFIEKKLRSKVLWESTSK